MATYFRYTGSLTAGGAIVPADSITAGESRQCSYGNIVALCTGAFYVLLFYFLKNFRCIFKVTGN